MFRILSAFHLNHRPLFLSMVCLVQSTFLNKYARSCHKLLTEDANFRIWFKDIFGLKMP